MARPKMNEAEKRRKLTLTISAAAYEYTKSLQNGGISISTICEKAIIREYKKALKAEKIHEADLPGQMSLKEL